MQFETLQNARTRPSRSTPSEVQGEAKIQNAFRQIELAYQEEFREPKRLRKAAQTLIRLIEEGSEDTRCHMGMAYIFGILDQPAAGIEFLEAAAEIEPGNPMIAILSSQLEGLQGPENLPIEDAIDLDELYEQTQQELLKEINVNSLKKIII